jgi:hypothetical protein
MPRIEARRNPRPTITELLREITDVATDLPLFLTAPLYRRRHLPRLSQFMTPFAEG